MMKRILSLLLALVFTLSFASQALGMAVYSFSSDGVGLDSQIISMTAVDSTLYLMYSNGKIYSRPVAKDEPVELGQVESTAYISDPLMISGDKPGFDSLFTMDGQPYGLCLITGEVYRLLNDQLAFEPQKLDVKLDTSVFLEKSDEYSSLNQPTSLFCQDKWLYYTCVSYSSGYAAYAGRISLETGKAQAFATKNITSLSPYKDGKVLALLYDASMMYSMSAQGDMSAPAQYAIFDPAADKAEAPVDIETDGTLGGYGVSGLCYGADSMYYLNGSRVMGVNLPSGESRISAYTGEGMFGRNSGGYTLFADGHYVSFDYSGLRVFPLDSENLKNGALVIFGEFGSDAHRSFTKNHPEIPVDVSGDYSSDIEKLTQAMVSENQPYDVLMLNFSYMPVERLLQKGYCEDLSGYLGLVERVERMYPQFAEAMKVDGKLYGVPVAMDAVAFGVNMEIWESLGLTEEDLPKSLPELYDFAANWAYDYGDDHADVQLFNYGKSRDILYSLMITQYMAYLQHKGEDLRFDTEAFQKLMSSFEAIDFTEFEKSDDGENSNFWVQDSLFNLSMSVGYLGQSYENYAPIYLATLEGEEPFLAANISVLTINPKSQRKDAAVLYLENYLDNLPANAANVTLFPDHNESVEDSGYARRRQECEDAIADIKKRLETVSEEGRATTENDLALQEEYLADLEKYRYTVSAENIANYRETVVPLLFLQKQNVLFSGDTTATTEINKLLMQYLEGALDSTQVAKELDKRIKLMEMENQ